MINFDKRIKSEKIIFNYLTRAEASKYIGTYGYFADRLDEFKDLSNVTATILYEIKNIEDCFFCDKAIGGFRYFIPVELLADKAIFDELACKEPKKKYRPYSLEEFLEIFGIGDLIYFKGKGCCDDEVKVAMFTGYITDVERIDDKTPGACEVMLGIFHYSLFSLFEDFERFYNGRWWPFGVEDDSDEQKEN